MKNKDMISKRVVACVNCDMWRSDARWPSADRSEVLFESFQRGLCTGPLETGKFMTPRNRCRAWRIWAKLNKQRSHTEKEDIVTAEDILAAGDEIFR